MDCREEFDPWGAASDHYEKILRGSISQRGGYMDWIDTNDPQLQDEFIKKLQRLLGEAYRIRVNGCYFSVERIIKKGNREEER